MGEPLTLEKAQELINELRNEIVQKKEKYRGEIKNKMEENEKLLKEKEELESKLKEYESKSKEYESKLNSLVEFQKKASELENKLKEIEEQRLKEKEDFKTLYEQTKSEKEKLLADIESTKKVNAELESFRKSILEKQEKEKAEKLEKLKSIDPEIYEISQSLNSEQIDKLIAKISVEKNSKTHLFPGTPKIKTEKEIKLDGKSILKAEKENPEVIEELLKNFIQ